MTRRTTYTGLLHAGAGTGLAVVQLSALIPGLLPSLALLAVLTAVLVLPLVALALVAAVLAAPPVLMWRILAARANKTSIGRPPTERDRHCSRRASEMSIRAHPSQR